MTLNIGIIGCGHMGGTHARILANDPRVKVAAVADVERARAETLAHGIGARAFTSMRDLLGAGLDAVFVTTPNTLHTEAVLAALEGGLHVFSEKPMATRLDEARQIRDAANAAKGIYQVGHNRRFAPVYRYCKRAIEQGFAVTSAHIKMNRGELQNPPWVGNTAITGGFLYETTVHLLDMARWLIGEIVELECRGAARVYGEVDNFTMLLSFAGGQCATFASCAHTTWAFPFEMIELYGAHAQIVTQEMEKVTHSARLGEDVITHDFFQLPLPQKWGYVEEDRLFVDAMLNGGASTGPSTPSRRGTASLSARGGAAGSGRGSARGAPAVSADDGYRSIELVEAVYQSAREGGARIKL